MRAVMLRLVGALGARSSTQLDVEPVAVAAPGVEILAAAPDGKYQITSGTSVAAAHVSGVAALLLATKPKLTPAQVRGNLVRSAHRVPGSRNEVGAGVVDALAVVNPGAK